MKVVKKYTAIKVNTFTNPRTDNVEVELTYGQKDYMSSSIQQEFDTEEEAIKAAYEYSKYSNWLIVPIVSFENIY